MRLVDSLKMPTQESKTWHLSNGEIGILSFNSPSHIAETDDFFDLPTPRPAAPVETKTTATPAVEEDDLDFLAPSKPDISQIRIELTVDGRVITPKAAKTYLKTIKDFVEKSPEELLSK